MALHPVEIGTFTTDAHLVVTDWSASLASISGISEADAVGRPLRDVIPSLADRGLLRRFDDVLQTGSVHVFSPAIHRYLLPCPPRVPSRRFTEMQQRATVGPLRDGEAIVGVMVAIEDVTERVEAERDLADSLAGTEDTWNARRAALQRLTDTAPADFASALVDVLRSNHRNFNVLSSTMDLLAGTTIDLSEPLAELLRDSDPDLRIQAALALGRSGGTTAASALMTALDDGNVNVQFQAIESLGHLRATEAVPRLLELATSADSFLAFAAIGALASIGDVSAVPRLMPLLERHDVKPAVVDAVTVLGADAESLAPVLTVADVIQALMVAGDEPRAVLIAALGSMRTGDALSALIDLLAEPESRYAASEALAHHGAAAIDPLIARLATDDSDTRRAVVLALARIGSTKATPALLSLLAEGGETEAVAAGALARLGDRRAFEPLMALVGHHDAAVRQTVVAALNAVSHPDMPARVATLLESDDPRILESAIRIAGYFGYPAARPRVLEAASRGEGAVRAVALEQLPFIAPDDALDTLVAAIDDAAPDVRVAAVKALARVEGEGACEALMRSLGDRHLWVRYFAARSLAELRCDGAGDVLADVARTDGAPPVRIAAIEALSSVLGERARAILIGLSTTTPSEVAKAAIETLTALDARSDDGV